MTERSALVPIVQASTASLIADQLREAIADGEFPPGAQLGEAALAARLGVSRGPLREAMQRLTQEGLLVSRRNRGLFVMELDEPAIRDIYLARGAVERTAVSTVIDNGWHDVSERLLATVQEMAAYDGEPGHHEVSALDMRFHRELVLAARSPRLALMHATLLTQVRMCMTRMEHTYDDVEVRMREHAGIAEAIAAQDADAADRALTAHMEDGLRRVLRAAGSADG